MRIVDLSIRIDTDTQVFPGEPVPAFAPASALATSQIASGPSRRLESGSIAGAIQLELVPQQVGRAARSEFAAALEPRRTIDAEGVVLTRLILEASLTTDDLLLIVPLAEKVDQRIDDRLTDALDIVDVLIRFAPLTAFDSGVHS